jgi:hypothetical protein
MPRGAIVGLEQTWTLARLWYQNRLDPEWRRPTTAEASATFRAAGLDGEFWSLG